MGAPLLGLPKSIYYSIFGCTYCKYQEDFCVRGLAAHNVFSVEGTGLLIGFLPSFPFLKILSYT